MDRQTDEQTDRQTDGPMDRATDGQRYNNMPPIFRDRGIKITLPLIEGIYRGQMNVFQIMILSFLIGRKHRLQAISHFPTKFSKALL